MIRTAASIVLALSLPALADDPPVQHVTTPTPKPQCYAVSCRWSAKTNAPVRPDTECVPGWVPDVLTLEGSGAQVVMCVCCPAIDGKPEKPKG